MKRKFNVYNFQLHNKNMLTLCVFFLTAYLIINYKYYFSETKLAQGNDAKVAFQTIHI